MRKYARYKDSGISWIGEVPEHWDVRYLFQKVREHYISNKEVHHQNLLSLSYGRIIQKDINKTEGLLPESFDTYQIVENGNIVLRLTDLQNDHKSLRVGLVTQEGIITSAYECLEVFDNSLLPVYLYYQLHSFDIKKMFYGMGGGLRQNLNYNELKKIRMVVPPPSEQKAIAEYLNKKTAQINELVAAKQKQIELLKEYKQSIIANAVTGKLAERTGSRPTDERREKINWIGYIPRHWQKRKFQYLFKERSEKNHPEEPVLCATQSRGVIPQSMYENRVVVVNTGFDGLKFVKKGDFVISLRSFQGGIEYAYYQGIISAAYTILYINTKDLYSDYVRLLFKSVPFIGLLQTCVTGIREGQNINNDLLRKQIIPVPPLSEQKEIVAYIEKKVSSIDSQITSIENQIANLNEYKQSLISDVVTGKVKV